MAGLFIVEGAEKAKEQKRTACQAKKVTNAAVGAAFGGP